MKSWLPILQMNTKIKCRQRALNVSIVLKEMEPFVNIAFIRTKKGKTVIETNFLDHQNRIQI